MKRLRWIVVSLMPKRIWQQIGLAFAVLLAASLLALGILLIKTSRNAVTASVLRDYEELTHRVVGEINNHINMPQELLANTACMMGAVTMEDKDTQQMLIYQLVTEHMDLFERIALVDKDGEELVNSDLEPKANNNPAADIFRDVIRRKKAVISKVYFSREHLPYLTIAVPVKKLNELSGGLIAEVKLSSIWNVVKDVSLTGGEAFLVDEAGYVLLHNEEKKVYRGENLKGLKTVRAVLEGNSGSVEEADLGKETRWLSAYAPIKLFGWGLIIRQPVEEAYAFSFRMQEKAVVIVALAIGLAILLSLLIANWIVHPLKRLTDATEKVAAGDLEQRIKASRTDEVGKLMWSFDNMIGRLKMAKQMEKLSNIGMTTSKIAHELRNPLVAIKTFMQLLPKRHNDERFISQFNDTVPQELSRLEKMVAMLNDFSSVKQLYLKECDIVPIINNIMELYNEQASSQNIKAVMQVTPENINLKVDPDKLKQVLINLVQNSFEAMPKGGALRIKAGITTNGKLLGANEHEKIVEISISDTGHGMNIAELAYVFEPFYTSKRGGMGLGLPISKEIIEQHKGNLEVMSEKDKGTTFTIKLPIRDV
ncbi:MAG: sensor histidine kinase [Planctomycetes bacterium]|nr:sensor histidine kinase [Planctomycetota bacterium]